MAVGAVCHALSVKLLGNGPEIVRIVVSRSAVLSLSFEEIHGPLIAET